MSFFDAFRIRRGRGGKAAALDREATPQDLDDLREFVRTRPGVELYVEPETMVTDTTAVAIATDGEWIRRRVGSPKVARRVAQQLGIPAYDAQIVGYPRRMREYNARLKREGRTDRHVGRRVDPPVRTQRPPERRAEDAGEEPAGG